MIKKYGDVVRVAPNEIVFATSQAAIDIYNPAVRHQETWLKTDIMDFGAGDGGFIWEQDPVKRREVARKILPAFSTKAIKAKEPIVQKSIDMFITKMKAVGDDPKGVQLSAVPDFYFFPFIETLTMMGSGTLMNWKVAALASDGHVGRSDVQSRDASDARCIPSHTLQSHQELQQDLSIEQL
ncbi:hypothetical protein NPX13_g2538 [Xylaria arbuscula]|uniref:Uncharacterized protein n=1 Tax=Xylaria arbuscula TaxID=114810 RepID=A0A9W8NKI0_9PEZI|nr:hypothetical protein NPX13_g2538 [Xylaria arbuscula]